MHRQTDEELVIAVREGDIQSFETLVKRYQRGLFSFVMRFLRDEGAASDIVQETLFTIYQVIDRVDTSKKFSTFVFEIAKNKSISLLRARKKHISLEEVADMAEDESFIEQFLRKDLALSVRAAVKKLPGKYRDVISLYYFDELSYEEVSQKLALPVNTIRTHLRRAKTELKKHISL
jgi:RNA polymerase sigma-70 factor, ECF subfamily